MKSGRTQALDLRGGTLSKEAHARTEGHSAYVAYKGLRAESDRHPSTWARPQSLCPR